MVRCQIQAAHKVRISTTLVAIDRAFSATLDPRINMSRNASTSITAITKPRIPYNISISILSKHVWRHSIWRTSSPVSDIMFQAPFHSIANTSASLETASFWWTNHVRQTRAPTLPLCSGALQLVCFPASSSSLAFQFCQQKKGPLQSFCS